MTTPASHYHCVFMGPFVYTLHFTWKMVHYSTLMSGRQPGHRDGEAGKRGFGPKPKTLPPEQEPLQCIVTCWMLVLEPRSHSSASTLTPDWLYFARYFSLFILPSYSLNGPSLISFSNAAKSHIFRKASAGPMTEGSSEVEGGCWGM